MFVCLDQLCNNKLVGNKSSSLMHLHTFKAKEGRVTRPVQGLSKPATNFVMKIVSEKKNDKYDVDK